MQHNVHHQLIGATQCTSPAYWCNTMYIITSSCCCCCCCCRRRSHASGGRVKCSRLQAPGHAMQAPGHANQAPGTRHQAMLCRHQAICAAAFLATTLLPPFLTASCTAPPVQHGEARAATCATWGGKGRAPFKGPPWSAAAKQRHNVTNTTAHPTTMIASRLPSSDRLTLYV